MNRHLREKLDYIKEQGLSVVEVARGVHYKIHVRRPGEPRTFMLVAARTSTSASGLANFKALVRRVARGQLDN